MKVVAVVPPGFERQAANEFLNLGAEEVQPLRRGVSFQADNASIY